MFRLIAASCLGLLLAAHPALAQPPARPAPAASPAKPVPPPVTTPKPATAPAPAPAAEAKRIDLNGAAESDLDTLPGVGPARAKAIVANRPYDTMDAVAAKKAVPAGVLAGIRNRVALANINTSTAKDLARTLPGIGDARSGQIVSSRPYATPGDLVSKGVLTQAAFDKIKDLITY